MGAMQGEEKVCMVHKYNCEIDGRTQSLAGRRVLAAVHPNLDPTWTHPRSRQMKAHMQRTHTHTQDVQNSINTTSSLVATGVRCVFIQCCASSPFLNNLRMLVHLSPLASPLCW